MMQTPPHGSIDNLVDATIRTVAPTISKQPLGLVSHRPEVGAGASRCFENVDQKVARDGGSRHFGWTFHHRYAATIEGPGYVYLVHHAVWRAQNGCLIDVTPYPDAKHRPLSSSGSIIFLVDDTAKPVSTFNMIALLPMRFFPIEDNVSLSIYVSQLNEKEQEKCCAIYASACVAKPV